MVKGGAVAERSKGTAMRDNANEKQKIPGLPSGLDNL